MKLKRQQQGLATVDFAIVSLLLLTIMFGIFEMGILLYDQAIITNASREAARSGIVLRKNPLTPAQIQAVATNYCLNNLVTFQTGVTPTVTVTQLAADTIGSPLRVNVTYNYTYLVLSTLTAGVIPSTKLLTATSTMYYE
jgi:Flp pilus assembly protein TadG